MGFAAKKRAAANDEQYGRMETAARGFGPGSGNLKLVSRLLGISIGQRGTDVIISAEAPPDKAQTARKVLEGLSAMASGGVLPSEWDTECLVNLALNHPEADLLEYSRPSPPSHLSRRQVAAKNPAQRRYMEAIAQHDLVFGLGPAGTGKTYLAVAMAVAALADDRVQKIIITRPAVEAGERLGFLPGDLAEKIDPYLRPIYDALDDLIAYEKYVKLCERRVIEVAPLAFMRGRTLSSAFVILDEAQNCTREQMKMFLTRLGPGSKAVVTGDPGQSDLPGAFPAGLREAVGVLDGIEGIALCRFGAADVVRHRLVKKIIEAYDRASAENSAKKEHHDF
jgi:phosphate starvation-inducible PhoH-like protein